MTASDGERGRVPFNLHLNALWPWRAKRLGFVATLRSLGFTDEDTSGPGERLLGIAGAGFNAADTWHDWPDWRLAEALSELKDKVGWLRAFTAGEEWARIIPKRRPSKKGTSATQVYLRDVHYGPQAKARAELYGPRLDGRPLNDDRVRSELMRALNQRQGSLKEVGAELASFEAAISDALAGLQVSTKGRPGPAPALVDVVREAAILWHRRHGRFPPTEPGRPKSKPRKRFEDLLRALETAHLRRRVLTTPVINAGIKLAKANHPQKV